MTCGVPLLAANKPVDVYWSLPDGKVALFCPEPTAFAIAAARGNDLREREHPLLATRIADGLIWTRLDRGDHTVTGAGLRAETAGLLQKRLDALRQASSRQAPPQSGEQLPADLAALHPVTTRQVPGAVAHILPGPDRNGIASVYVVSETNRAYSLAIDGTLLGEIQSPAKIMSAVYWPPSAGAARADITVPPPIMRGLVVLDFQGQGRKHVVAATDEGLVTAFQADGKQAWACYLPSAPRSLCRLPRDGGDLLAVGCDNGLLLWIDAAGKPVAKAQLAGAVRRLYAAKNGVRLVLVAGTVTGAVALFHSR